MTLSVRFVIPAKSEFVGLVRLAIGGLAPAMPFNADTVEDMKLVMSEICTNIILGVPDETAPAPELSFVVTFNPADVTIEIDSSEAVDDLLSAASPEWTKPQPAGYGLSIITALMDSVELVPGGDHRSILRLKKFT